MPWPIGAVASSVSNAIEPNIGIESFEMGGARHNGREQGRQLCALDRVALQSVTISHDEVAAVGVRLGGRTFPSGRR